MERSGKRHQGIELPSPSHCRGVLRAGISALNFPILPCHPRRPHTTHIYDVVNSVFAESTRSLKPRSFANWRCTLSTL